MPYPLDTHDLFSLSYLTWFLVGLLLYWHCMSSRGFELLQRPQMLKWLLREPRAFINKKHWTLHFWL